MSTMTGREMLELEVIKNCLSYNKETGQLLWIKTNSNVSVAGSIAGRSLNSDGYKHVTVAGIGYKAHRLAWLLTHGKWPKVKLTTLTEIGKTIELQILEKPLLKLTRTTRGCPTRTTDRDF